ncbi:lipid kinase, YegS/Rv2252/BmrU family [Halobacillus karajensis]|uniref:Lipid kinase BmrU n=1 Tax=Halobacillus karajensis TaxID=195088 RepID=A0A024P9C1_9BACI|nr:YegS/Rv2252/BmrU family lipid kinase [Halobacillus karajensis]CDQ21518.1 Putative lipid kinase BmrU [Halobacillus karajensis]CDQ25453.1 Putative lipid kinase BmrU [Halobacillus karajensis]CDQ29016.1 Putative lipid kinase BmrU [Halobacillus karajensis]SEI09321.1 lipid kinase, YegS/Rv2252/BmrU family [Halobacillus karajensis]
MPRYQSGVFLYNGNKEEAEIETALSQTLPILSKEVKELKVIQTASLEDLYETCRRYGPEVDVFFIFGGDGTVHEVINSLAPLEIRPVIGVIPGGTCNDFSRVLDTKQRPDQAAESIIKGDEVKVDAGRTEDDYFINFWGIGLVTQTSVNIDEGKKNRLGVLSYFISALRTVNQAAPFRFKMAVDDEMMEGEAVMILIMNGQFIGTRRLPVPSIDLQDGKVDVLIVKNSNLTLFRELMTMGRPQTDETQFQELSHHQGSTIKIDVEKKQDVDMDGEIKGKTPESIKVLPNHFTFLSGGSEALQNLVIPEEN